MGMKKKEVIALVKEKDDLIEALNNYVLEVEAYLKQNNLLYYFLT